MIVADMVFDNIDDKNGKRSESFINITCISHNTVINLATKTVRQPVIINTRHSMLQMLMFH